MNKAKEDLLNNEDFLRIQSRCIGCTVHRFEDLFRGKKLFQVGIGSYAKCFGENQANSNPTIFRIVEISNFREPKVNHYLGIEYLQNVSVTNIEKELAIFDALNTLIDVQINLCYPDSFWLVHDKLHRFRYFEEIFCKHKIYWRFYKPRRVVYSLFAVFKIPYGGETLVSALELWKLLPHHLVGILCQLSLVLAYAEVRIGLIHCDLHPENILLLPTDEESITYQVDKETFSIPTFKLHAKIIDFGNSKIVKDGFGKLWNSNASDLLDIHSRIKNSNEEYKSLVPNLEKILGRDCREQLFLNGILDLKLAEFPLKMIFVKDAQKFQRTDENVQKFTGLIKENPRTTLLELEQDTGISKTTIGRIVTKSKRLLQNSSQDSSLMSKNCVGLQPVRTC
ncbi:GSG2 [Cordylochernes scorpioides]|uniref:GSG2 n=1 Tax=Cordylochernes scorpioides TaxID=51811 RepID=A0ABY6K5N3_9ARAC|nr:GSG2 [Cordylochernes scorpioides]